jgi:DNA-binding response OmpR family regulator
LGKSRVIFLFDLTHSMRLRGGEMLAKQRPLAEEQHTTRKVILFVEDDPNIGEFLLMAISQETPYQALLAASGERALEIVQHIKPSLFVLDYYLGTMNGLCLYDRLHAQQGLEAIPAIIMSAGSSEHQDEIDQRHLLNLAKPFDIDDLLLSIRRALN